MQVTKIRLERAEGPIPLPPPYECASYESASARLALWARTAPVQTAETGGYDKTDFVVTFEDGETYAGRLDLTREHTGGYDLRQHIINFCRFYGGLDRPSHITPRQYETIVHRGGSDPAQFREFLSKYMDVTA